MDNWQFIQQSVKIEQRKSYKHQTGNYIRNRIEDPWTLEQGNVNNKKKRK
jgi:hypothetical protein